MRAWAEIANKRLALNGHDMRLIIVKLEQGIQLEPQHKIGATVACEQMVGLKIISALLGKMVISFLQNPEIALNALPDNNPHLPIKI